MGATVAAPAAGMDKTNSLSNCWSAMGSTVRPVRPLIIRRDRVGVADDRGDGIVRQSLHLVDDLCHMTCDAAGAAGPDRHDLQVGPQLSLEGLDCSLRSDRVAAVGGPDAAFGKHSCQQLSPRDSRRRQIIRVGFAVGMTKGEDNHRALHVEQRKSSLVGTAYSIGGCGDLQSPLSPFTTNANARRWYRDGAIAKGRRKALAPGRRAFWVPVSAAIAIPIPTLKPRGLVIAIVLWMSRSVKLRHLSQTKCTAI